MTTEIIEPWRETTAWLARHAPRTHAALNPPASAGEIAEAERELGCELPQELVTWWTRGNGVHGGFNGQILPAFMPCTVAEMLDSRRSWLRIALEQGALYARSGRVSQRCF